MKFKNAAINRKELKSYIKGPKNSDDTNELFCILINTLSNGCCVNFLE